MSERLEYGKRYRIRLSKEKHERDAWYIGSSVDRRGASHSLLLESINPRGRARVIKFNYLYCIEGDKISISYSRSVKLTKPQREYAEGLLKNFNQKLPTL